jgi:hypothetical protein
MHLRHTYDWLLWQQVANNKTDDYIVQVVDNLIRLPKISESDLDKAERDIRKLSQTD